MGCVSVRFFFIGKKARNLTAVCLFDVAGGPKALAELRDWSELLSWNGKNREKIRRAEEGAAFHLALDREGGLCD